MGETALLLFSICLQAAIGTMLFITLGKQLYKDKVFKKASLCAAGLSVIGVLASLVHLGQPLLALNSLFNLGSSWLSKEVFLSGAFMVIAVAYALVQYLKPENLSLNNVLRWAGSIAGLLTVFSMAKVYTFTTVPVWQGVNTFVDFYATAIVLGALIFVVSALGELQDVDKRLFGFIILAAVIIQASVAVPSSIGLGLSGKAAQASATILSSLGVAITLKWLLVLGGAGTFMWLAAQKTECGIKNPQGLLYAVGLALVVGQIIGRYVFYAAFITSGIGLT